MSKVLDLNAENFTAEALNSELPVLVDFWAPWCMPCRMMAPTLDELSEEFAGRLKFAKVNIEDGGNQALAEKYQVQSIPNLKLFKSGQVAGEFIGLRNKESLKGEISALI